MNLCEIYSGKLHNLNIHILHVAKDQTYEHRISGYTNVSAIASLMKKNIDPDLVISFGTSGGYGCKTGDVVIG